MGRPVSFVHAADLHIGAPFRGISSKDGAWAERMRHATLDALETLREHVAERDVDFVVIAGDVFDTSSASYAERLAFRRFAEAMDDRGLTLTVCCGNHDPYQSYDLRFFSFPDNTKLLRPLELDWRIVEREGEPLVTVAGTSYANQTWPQDRDISAGVSRENLARLTGVETPYVVGLLHTGLDQDRIKAPVPPSELYGRGVDYWACGHIHKRWCDDPADPKIVFPGVIQGRDIKEEGPRGAAFVTLETGRPNRMEFLPCAALVWARIDVDVTGASDLDEVKGLVTRAQFTANGRAACRHMCFRIRLTGASPTAALLADPATRAELAEDLNRANTDFYVDEITSCVAPFESGFSGTPATSSADRHEDQREGGSRDAHCAAARDAAVPPLPANPFLRQVLDAVPSGEDRELLKCFLKDAFDEEGIPWDGKLLDHEVVRLSDLTDAARSELELRLEGGRA